MKRAAAYARYSSSNQQELSIEGQLQYINEYAEKNNFEIVKAYIDRGVSAFDIDKRKGFHQLLDDAEKGLFDVVIVWAFDRFARSRNDSRKYKTQLENLGIKVISVTELIPDGDVSVITESLYEGLAEWLPRKLARDTMRGMIAAAKQGRHTGSVAPFGYDRMKTESGTYLVINKKEAPIVRKMFNMASKGSSYSEIASFLNNRGIKTRSGNPFTIDTIRYMIHNKIYMGVKEFNKRRDRGKFNPFYGVVKVDVPNLAIVSQDEWEAAQKGIKRTRKRKARMTYLLSGVLYCKYGHKMTGSTYNASSKSGRYRCPVCHKRRVNISIGKNFAENTVLNYLSVMLTAVDLEQLLKIVNQRADEIGSESSKKVLNDQLREVDTKITNITTAIETGITSKTLVERLQQLEIKRDKLVKQLKDVEASKTRKWSFEELKEQIEAARKTLINGEKQEKKWLIQALINRIDFDEQDRVMTINSMFGRTTIPIIRNT